MGRFVARGRRAVDSGRASAAAVERGSSTVGLFMGGILLYKMCRAVVA